MTNQQSLQRPANGGARDLKALLTARLPTITELAGKYLNPERLLGLTMAATTKTPALLQCSQDTVLQSVMDAARLGLEPDGVEGAIIPYGKVAQFIPMVQGLVHVTLDEGSIVGIDMRVVRDGDEFDCNEGSKPFIHHKRNLRLPANAPVLAYYSIAHRLDGSSTFEIMTLAEILDHKARFARGGDKGPWATSFDEMAKKTVFKRHSKKLPKGRRLRDVISHDNVVEMSGLDLEVKTTATTRQKKLDAAIAGNKPEADEPPADDVPQEPPEMSGQYASDAPPAVPLLVDLARKMPADRAKIAGYCVNAAKALSKDENRLLVLVGKYRIDEPLMESETSALAPLLADITAAGGFLES